MEGERRDYLVFQAVMRIGRHEMNEIIFMGEMNMKGNNMKRLFYKYKYYKFCVRI